MDKVKTEQFFSRIPVILTGDFNAEPDSEEIGLIKKTPGFVNVTDGIGVTYHGYGCENPESIDYIYVKGAENCGVAERWTDEENGVYLSDHYPVCAELNI